MRLLTKVAIVSAAAVAVGTYKGNIDAQKSTLSADDFNAMQDQDFLKKAFKDLDGQNIAFYRLKSCPYCSMTQALLDYGKLHYHEVCVDPITAYGMPNHGYPLCPQLHFLYDSVRRTDPKDKEPMKHGAFLVDSDAIAKKLAPVLGVGATIDDPRVVKSRAWLRDTFVRSSYVAMNGSYALAFSSYPGMVPERWNNGPCRMIGAGALWFLCKYMVRPRLESRQDNGFTADATTPPDVLLQNAAEYFSRELIPTGKRFHGGERPDLVDVELYGLVRNTCHQSAPARLVLERTQLEEWRQLMKHYIPVQNNPKLI